MSIYVRAEVKIDHSEFCDSDIIELIATRLKRKKMLADRYKEDDRQRQAVKDFVREVSEAVGVDVPHKSETILDEMIERALEEVRVKFALEEIEAFLKTK